MWIINKIKSIKWIKTLLFISIIITGINYLNSINSDYDMAYIRVITPPESQIAYSNYLIALSMFQSFYHLCIIILIIGIFALLIWLYRSNNEKNI